MPHCFPCPEAANRHAMFDDVGDDIDFRMTLDEALPVFLDWRFVKGAEAAAERERSSSVSD